MLRLRPGQLMMTLCLWGRPGAGVPAASGEASCALAEGGISRCELVWVTCCWVADPSQVHYWRSPNPQVLRPTSGLLPYPVRGCRTYRSQRPNPARPEVGKRVRWSSLNR